MALALIFDTLIKIEHRRTMSDFFYGYRKVSSQKFMKVVVTSIFSWFTKKGTDELSLFKVSLISLLIFYTTIFYLIFFEIGSDYFHNEMIKSKSGYATLFFAYAFGSICLDYYSLLITRRVFINSTPNYFIIAIIVTGVVSALPLVVLGYFIAGLSSLFQYFDFKPRDFSGGEAITNPYVLNNLKLGLGADYVLLSGFASIFFISAIQIIVYLFSIPIRIMSRIADLSYFISEKSKIRDYPFTVIGLVLGVVLYIQKLVF